MSRSSQHAEVMASWKDLHENARDTTDAPAGKGCLVAHDGRRRVGPSGKTYERSCNYRWQAFQRALTEDQRYNWPKYKPLGVAANAWDVSATGTNFRVGARVPYWHEAHHIIPNSVLWERLQTFAAGTSRAEVYLQLYRRGLMEEGYNLNHMNNMVILPMERAVGKVLELPAHREDAWAFHHEEYNNKAMTDLSKVLADIKEAEHQPHSENGSPPEYAKCRERIEKVSTGLRSWIYEKGTAGGSLDSAARKKKGK